jgi:hypothetical protein
MNRLFTVYGLLFTALFAIWEIGEAQEPGQQYADPLLPVTYCTWLLGMPVAAVLIALELRKRDTDHG